MKNLRQAEILNIVQSVDIETQEQMLEELKSRGISATQATISRDIKELRLVKVLTGKGAYRYAPSERKGAVTSDTRLRNIFKGRGHLGGCGPEYRSGQDDARDWPQLPVPLWTIWRFLEFVGSLAGDDTGILIMRDSAAAQSFNSEVHKLLK